MQEIIDRIAGSKHFEKAPVLRELLLYLWRERESELSEFGIGVEVLGRRQDFNPKTDATVRVQIGRLRQRLKEYFEQAGANDDVRVEIPLGSHRLQFIPVSKRGAWDWRWAAVAVIVLLASDNLRLRWQTATKPELPRFWQPFAKAVNVVVPVPLFYHWPEDEMVARSFKVNRLGEEFKSRGIQSLIGSLGKPDMSQLYTVASDTVAAASIGNFLQDRGVPVSVFDTSTAPIETLGSKDAVMLVGPGTIRQLDDLRINRPFDLEQGTSIVRNLKPVKGEPEYWKGSKLAPQRVIAYGTISVVAGREDGRRVLIVASSYNPALASILTASSGLAQLPDGYFDAVVEYERNGDRTLRAKVVAVRTIAK